MNANTYRCAALIAAPLLVFVTSRFADAAPGDVYSSDLVAANIVRYAADGKPTVIAAPAKGALAGLKFDGRGNLFVAEYATDAIIKITPRGDVTTFATGVQPTGMAFDGAGNLFVGDANTNSVIQIAPDGTKTTAVSGVQSVSGLAFDRDGALYVAQGAAGVLRVARGNKTTFVSGLNAFDVTFNPAGDLFVSSNTGGTVTRVSPAGAKTPFATIPGAAGLAFDASGNLFVSQSTGNGAIMLITSNGVMTTFFTGNGTSPAFLTVEPVMHSLLNISTRGVVGTGDHVLIAGFIVGGGGEVDGKVIVRALGPSLPVNGALQDPTLSLVDSDGITIATNDDWKSSQAAVAATGVPPSDDRESAIVASLPAGSYTAAVRGAGDGTGDALVEIYNLQ